MAIGDRVVVLRNVKTVDPKTGNVESRGIPKNSLGTVIQEESSQRFGDTISVEFDNGKIASFGDSLTDKLGILQKNPKEEQSVDVSSTLRSQ